MGGYGVFRGSLFNSSFQPSKAMSESVWQSLWDPMSCILKNLDLYFHSFPLILKLPFPVSWVFWLWMMSEGFLNKLEGKMNSKRQGWGMEGIDRVMKICAVLLEHTLPEVSQGSPHDNCLLKNAGGSLGVVSPGRLRLAFVDIVVCSLTSSSPSLPAFWGCHAFWRLSQRWGWALVGLSSHGDPYFLLVQERRLQLINVFKDPVMGMAKEWTGCPVDNGNYKGMLTEVRVPLGKVSSFKGKNQMERQFVSSSGYLDTGMCGWRA